MPVADLPAAQLARVEPAQIGQDMQLERALGRGERFPVLAVPSEVIGARVRHGVGPARVRDPEVGAQPLVVPARGRPLRVGEGQDVEAVRVAVVVGLGDGLGLVAFAPEIAAGDPGAVAGAVAPVAQVQALRDRAEVGLAPRGEGQPGVPAADVLVADGAGHGELWCPTMVQYTMAAAGEQARTDMR